MRALAEADLPGVEERIEELQKDIQILLLPRDAADDKNAILEIRAGTGGDEAALFAGDLFRMYERYAAERGWRFETVSASDGDAGGFKEIIATISGKGVFAHLKFESGVHRVQRVPATEASGRIHTSAATVAVLPEAEEVDIDIRAEDIRIDTMRASGSGGQHVNTTDSAVRITHQPTGIIVASQIDRSQHKNREIAMGMLKARMFEAEMRRREEAASAEHASKSEIGWGHQIRSYVLQPYQQVKDLRTGYVSTAPDDVLDGDLDPFMAAALSQRVTGEKVDVEDVD
jgi:peptide chain release factor 1